MTSQAKNSAFQYIGTPIRQRVKFQCEIWRSTSLAQIKTVFTMLTRRSF